MAPRAEGADLEWVLRRDFEGFVLERAGHPPLRAPDEGRLLFAFERELTLAKAKLGELMMRLELAEVLIEKRGLLDEWKRSKR